MDLPQLPPMPMRPEHEPGYSKEIWQPQWRCFCCHDTGIVVSHLAAMVIKGYNANRSKFPLCQNPNCHAEVGIPEEYNHCLDFRFNGEICAELDKRERQSWQDWTKGRQQRLSELNTKVSALAEGMSLRKRQRTPSEEIEAQRRHQEVLDEYTHESVAHRENFSVGAEIIN
ncbi:MAG: hypothetical protein F6K58_25955 [Symploca sp. SIO2E9]|nr:hypothetical protein [Symploca sp. SIO2E9]